ncbi:MAG: VOC family protein [Phycisphaerales bacterium]|nr:VOC family protein [Phycisphaerales bacterium]
MSEHVCRGLSEIVLIVDDVARGAAFYRDAIRLISARPANDEWAWFRAGVEGDSCWLALHKGALLFEEHSPRKDLPMGARFGGATHFALRVDIGRLDECAAHLRGMGVEVHGPVDFDWMGARGARSIYCFDPDGNLVELWAAVE